MVRYTVHFCGHVQGVGFRFTTVRIADRFEIAGFVHNLPDGRVRVVAEGKVDVLDLFLGAVQQEMGNYLDRTQIEKQKASGEFGKPGMGRFSVRY